MRYLDGVKTISPTDADNALIVGTAVHTGIERGLEEAIKEYSFSYPIITDEHINEIMKLEAVIPMAKAEIPPGGEFEVEISDSVFHGFIDYLVPIAKVGNVEYYDLYDFKYSNNVSGYKQTSQLHLYKYFFEKNNPGKKIENLYLLFIPKVKIQQKKDECLFDFRQRIKAELAKSSVQKVQLEYDYNKVIEFLIDIKTAYEESEFPKEQSYLCKYCEFQEFCEKGNDYMKLPDNKRRTLDAVQKRVLWIYGVPFCGKTTFANSFPDPLMLNTDGNIKFVDAPYIRIKDEVKVEGRQTKRTLAWDVFKDVISELEKKDNTFKTIVVDLLEDLYEHCRLYMYQQMGIFHESDDSFRAWDKVRGEFLNTLKRLMNLDYENIILISHEDTSKDITKKGGDKITAIKPNLQDKVANKVAGMVDVVARIVADGDTRTFSFKSNEVIFGGGRLKVNAKDIPLDVNALFAVYDEANKNAASGVMTSTASTTKSGRSTRRKAEESLAEVADKPQDKPAEEQTVNDTPEQESPQEAADKAEEEQPEQVAQQQEVVPVDDTVNSPEVPTEEEKPRRRRKARD